MMSIGKYGFKVFLDNGRIGNRQKESIGRIMSYILTTAI